MLEDNRHIKPFQGLLASLEEDGARAEAAPSRIDGYSRAILATRERISQMQALAPKALRSRDGEVTYFREIWPRVYGQLFYYQRVHAFYMERSALPPDRLAGMIRREELEAARYFRVNREFWLYYSSRSPVIDGQFTREYSRACVYDPLCLVIDATGATLASYQAAWGLAWERYISFLGKQKEGPATGEREHRYEWKETGSAAVELMKAQVEAGSIYIDGVSATMAKLVADFEQKYNKPIRDYNKLLHAATGRKIDGTPYLTKLKNAFAGRRARLRK